jgi:hypothetical protein
MGPRCGSNLGGGEGRASGRHRGGHPARVVEMNRSRRRHAWPSTPIAVSADLDDPLTG